MSIIKKTEKQINLCDKLDKKLYKDCMKIKVKYLDYDEDADVGLMIDVSSLFLDEDLDPIKIDYDQECVVLDTSDYQHIDLSENQLLFLLKFYRYAKQLDKKCFNMTKKQIKTFIKNARKI
jgi:hypothetical protein